MTQSISRHLGASQQSKVKQFQIIDYSGAIDKDIMEAVAEDSFTREVKVNSIQANAKNIVWGSTDPALVGLEGYNKVKLSHYNDGDGMTYSVLDKVCHFSSSHGRISGRSGNKGKGELFSGMRINSSGLVWISCALDKNTNLRKIYRVVMTGNPDTGIWGRKQFWVDNENVQGWQDIVDITEDIDLKALDLDIDKDWTLKIYCGQTVNQNTVTHPYGYHITEGWLVKELSRRFSILPNDVTVHIKHRHLTNDGKNKFIPILETIKKYEKETDIEYETVSYSTDVNGNPIIESLGKTIPFFTEPNTNNITFIYDPHCKAKNNETKSTSWYKSRMGITGVYSGLIHQDEIFDYKGPSHKGGNSWRQAAAQVGILNGWDQFRIFVSIPESDHIMPDDNRVKLLNLATNNRDPLQLKDFRNEIILSMPEWFRDKLDAMEDQDKEDLSEIRNRLTEVMKKLRVTQPATRVPGGTGVGPSNGGGPRDPKPYECPECAKTGTITIIPKGVRKCPSCGFIKPVKSSDTNPSNGGLVPDPNGRSRMIKDFPEILVLKKDQWKDKALCDNFEHMAAEYLEQDHKLYVNETYSSFKRLTNFLLEGLDLTNIPVSAQQKIFDRAEEKAKNYILYNTLGISFAAALTKPNKVGFKEGYETLTQPMTLSVYADAWYGNEIEKIKKSFQDDVKKQLPNTVESNNCQQDVIDPEKLKKKMNEAGNVKIGELA